MLEKTKFVALAFVNAAVMACKVFAFGHPSLKRSAQYDRFLKIPMVISLVLFLVLAAAFLQAYLTFIGGFLGGFVLACLLSPVLGLLVWVREVAKNTMAKHRIFFWLRYKFNNWNDVQEWLNLTPAYEIDMALELKDAEWLPKKGGGYEILSEQLCIK